MRYVYQEPKGHKLVDQAEIAKAAAKQRMANGITKATTITEYRIGRYVEGDFRGLYTLEQKVKGKWEPMNDGDLLEMVVNQMMDHVNEAVEQEVMSRRAAPSVDK